MSQKPKADQRRDDGVELETQLIVRLPEEAARDLRTAIREGGNDLKDRFNIKLDDLRYGEVQFDNFLYHAKVVDLPTIVESLKTIDKKSFYKTADICQLLICKDEPDAPSADDESPVKNKKKDPNKVDKKYLWPHGITPPCKNIRKRRFRKTLKKKNVEAPEIEKEVKRLLRTDNEAVNVKWELINEDEEIPKSGMFSNLSPDDASFFNAPLDESPTSSPIKNSHNSGSSSSKMLHMKQDGMDRINERGAGGSGINSGGGNDGGIMSSGSTGNQQHRVRDIFGEELSSSDEDDNNINVLDVMDEASALSQEDSRLSSYSDSKSDLPTHFKKAMFTGGGDDESKTDMGTSYYEEGRNDSNDEFYDPHAARDQIDTHIAVLRQQLEEYKKQRVQKEQEILRMENQTLRQRLQESLDCIMASILDREMELQELEMDSEQLYQ